MTEQRGGYGGVRMGEGSGVGWGQGTRASEDHRSLTPALAGPSHIHV